MRVSDRLDLLERLGRELQKRYTFTELDELLGGFKLPPLEWANGVFNSKRVYAKDRLKTAADELLLRVADELGIERPASGHIARGLPRNWQNEPRFKLFISHISKDKDKATRLRECLTPFGISGFVAHEDIHPTLEWQTEIERALHSMDAFLAIHTAGFSQSFWTQQEVGFAVGRGVKIISVKMGEDPTGFISKHQALPRRNRRAEAIAREINDILLADPVTADKLKTAKAASGATDDLPPF